jgi:hypothetical protein
MILLRRLASLKDQSHCLDILLAPMPPFHCKDCSPLAASTVLVPTTLKFSRLLFCRERNCYIKSCQSHRRRSTRWLHHQGPKKRSCQNIRLSFRTVPLGSQEWNSTSECHPTPMLRCRTTKHHQEKGGNKNAVREVLASATAIIMVLCQENRLAAATATTTTPDSNNRSTKRPPPLRTEQRWPSSPGQFLPLDQHQDLFIVIVSIIIIVIE